MPDKEQDTGMWEVIGKGRDPVPYEQDYFPESDFLGLILTGIVLAIQYWFAVYINKPIR